jgi:hypothetical protein
MGSNMKIKILQKDEIFIVELLHKWKINCTITHYAHKPTEIELTAKSINLLGNHADIEHFLMYFRNDICLFRNDTWLDGKDYE